MLYLKCCGSKKASSLLFIRNWERMSSQAMVSKIPFLSQWFFFFQKLMHQINVLALFNFCYHIVFMHLSRVSKSLNKYWASQTRKKRLCKEREVWHNWKTAITASKLKTVRQTNKKKSGRLCSERQSFSSDVNGRHLKTKILPCGSRVG